MENTTHILLFGDSLTEGYFSHGMAFHSYGLKLQELFDSNNLNVQITVSGVSGDRVLNNRWTQRLFGHLGKARNLLPKQRIVVILGGINDVFQTDSSQTIFDGLRRNYQACEEFKVDYVVGCSLLELSFGQDTEDEERRIAINENIAAYSTTSETTQFMFLDLCKKFPLHTLSDEQKKLYWDDGVHLTAKGYDRVGEIVFEMLKPLVAQQ